MWLNKQNYQTIVHTLCKKMFSNICFQKHVSLSSTLQTTFKKIFNNKNKFIAANVNKSFSKRMSKKNTNQFLNEYIF